MSFSNLIERNDKQSLVIQNKILEKWIDDNKTYTDDLESKVSCLEKELADIKENMKENVLMTSLDDMKEVYEEMERKYKKECKLLETRFRGLQQEMLILKDYGRRTCYSSGLFYETLRRMIQQNDKNIVLTVENLSHIFAMCETENQRYTLFVNEVLPLNERCINGRCGGCERLFCWVADIQR